MVAGAAAGASQWEHPSVVSLIPWESQGCRRASPSHSDLAKTGITGIILLSLHSLGSFCIPGCDEHSRAGASKSRNFSGLEHPSPGASQTLIPQWNPECSTTSLSQANPRCLHWNNSNSSPSSWEGATFQALMKILGQKHPNPGAFLGWNIQIQSIPVHDPSVKSGKQQSILMLSFPLSLGSFCFCIPDWGENPSTGASKSRSIPGLPLPELEYPSPGASQGWSIPVQTHPKPLSKIQDAAEHPHPQLSLLPGKAPHSRLCEPLRRLPVPGAAFPAHNPAGSVHLAGLCKL